MPPSADGQISCPIRPGPQPCFVMSYLLEPWYSTGLRRRLSKPFLIPCILARGAPNHGKELQVPQHASLPLYDLPSSAGEQSSEVVGPAHHGAGLGLDAAHTVNCIHRTTVSPERWCKAPDPHQWHPKVPKCQGAVPRLHRAKCLPSAATMTMALPCRRSFYTSLEVAVKSIRADLRPSRGQVWHPADGAPERLPVLKVSATFCYVLLGHLKAAPESLGGATRVLSGFRQPTYSVDDVNEQQLVRHFAQASTKLVWDRALLGMSSPCWARIEIWPGQPKACGRTQSQGGSFASKESPEDEVSPSGRISFLAAA